MNKRILLNTFFVVHIFLLTLVSATAQCGAGYTQAELNWDYLDFLPSNSATFYTPFYVAGITPYNQNFSMGPRRINFQTTTSVTLNGENATNTADAGSFATPGQDVQFTTTITGNSTITINFDIDVQNVKFSLFDLDNSQRVTISAANAALVAQNITITKANAASGITIAGSGGTTPVATGIAGAYTGADNNGTINVSIASDVKTIVITLYNAAGDTWLSDIDACVTGSFPNNWRAISRPFTGMPSYILTVMDSTFYILDPATGKTQFLYRDPGNEFINGMAYDPVHRLLYYNYTQTGTGTRTVYRYDIDTELRSIWVTDVNTAPLFIPTYTQGVESAAASFYDGFFYFGVEGNKTSGTGANTTGRENTIWKIELDAAQNPVRASQVYATRVDSVVAGNPALIHDWSDVGVTNNGMMYDFDGAPAVSGNVMANFYHFNMMTGQRVDYLATGTGINVPRQLAIDWQENVYDMGNVGNSPSDGFIVPYNYNGTINPAQNKVVTFKGVNLNGNFGDCSEAFRPYCDFGDAPASYDPDPWSPAVHERDTALHIGPTFDREWSKTSSALANADGADEDGLLYVPIFSPGYNTYAASCTVYNNTGETATLVAWMDYNGNGYFDNGEACQTQALVPSTPVLQSRFLYWPTAPSALANGTYTYLRIRLVKTSSLPALSNSTPTGYYDNGETEDYRVVVDNFPLSVNLVSFNVKVIAPNNAELIWKSSDEENFSRYEIQRSMDNNNWLSIDTVAAKGNAATGETSYTYNDLKPAKGKSYYRLKMISADGKYRYSDIKTITIEEGIEQMIISPNPATDNINISINSYSNEQVTIIISTIDGKTVHTQRALVKKGINNLGIPINKKMSSGSYLVRIEMNEQVFTQKLIINKN